MFRTMFFKLSFLCVTRFSTKLSGVINVDIYTSDTFRNAPLFGWLNNIFFGVTFNVNAMQPLLIPPQVAVQCNEDHDCMRQLYGDGLLVMTLEKHFMQKNCINNND